MVLWPKFVKSEEESSGGRLPGESRRWSTEARRGSAELRVEEDRGRQVSLKVTDREETVDLVEGKYISQVLLLGV